MHITTDHLVQETLFTYELGLLHESERFFEPWLSLFHYILYGEQTDLIVLVSPLLLGPNFFRDFSLIRPAQTPEWLFYETSLIDLAVLIMDCPPNLGPLH